MICTSYFLSLLPLVASLQMSNSSLDKSWPQESSSTYQSELVTSLLATLLDLEEPEVVFILAHDYQVLPHHFLDLLYHLHRPYIPVELPAPDTPTPEPEVNATRIIYSFSWLQDPNARRPGQLFFFAFICHVDNLGQLFETVASKIQMKPPQDRVFLWSRDQQVDEMTVFMHDHVYLFRYKMLACPGGEQDTAVIKMLCVYCDKGNPLVVELDRYMMGMNATELAPNLFPDTTGNFHGRFMSGVFIEPFSPASLKEKREYDLPVFAQEAIHEAVAESLNFNWEVLALDMGEEGVVETQLEDGTWMGMVGEILYQRADFGPATIYSEKALHVVDYPVAYYQDYVTYLTRIPDKLYSAKVIVQPYTYDMWILLFLATLVVGVVYFIFLWTLHRIHNPFSNRQPKNNFLYAMELIVLALIEEGPEYFPDSLTARLFAGFWWLVALVISCGYNSKMVALLSMPEMEKLPANIKELTSKDEWRWGAMHLHALFYDMLVENSQDQYLKKVGPKLETFPTLEDCVKESLLDDFACFSLRIFLTLVSFHFIDKNGQLPFRHAEEKALDVTAGFVLPKYHISTSAFSKKVRGLLNGGLIIHYEDEMNFFAFMLGLSSARNVNYVKHHSLALNWKQMQGPWFILCGGLGVSLVMLIAEVVSKKARKKNKNSFA